MRRTLSAALVLLALAAPAGAVAASGTTTGSVTTVPTLTTAAGLGRGVAVLATKKATHSSSGVSTGAAIAAVIAGLLALACLVWAVFRFGALEPPWLLSARHSLAEASFRTSATWAEFKDWARLGH